MGVLATAVVDVETNLRPLQTGLARAKESLTRFASEAKVIGRVPLGEGFNLRAIGLVAGAGGLGALLLDAAKKSSALGESMSKAKTVFGRDSAVVLQNTERLADKFGVARREAIDAASAFGLMGRAAGLSTEEQAKMANELTNLGIDLASFHNLSRQEAFTKLRAGLAGEAEPLRPLGIMLSEDAVKAEALAIGLTRVKRELTEQEKILARLSLIRRAAGPAIGDAERTAESTENIMRKAMGDLDNLVTKLGSSLEPALVSAIRLAEELGKSLEKGLGGQGGVFETAAKDANRAIGETRDLNAVLNSNLSTMKKIQNVWDILFHAERGGGPGSIADKLRGIGESPKTAGPTAAQVREKQIAGTMADIAAATKRAMGPSLEDLAKAEIGASKTAAQKREEEENRTLRAHMRRIEAEQDQQFLELVKEPKGFFVPHGGAGQRDLANQILDRVKVGAPGALNLLRNVMAGPIAPVMGAGHGGEALATGLAKVFGGPKPPEVQAYQDQIDSLKDDLKREQLIKAAKAKLGISDQPSQMFADPADFARSMVQGVLTGTGNDQVKALEDQIKILEEIRDKLPGQEKVERRRGIFPIG